MNVEPQIRKLTMPKTTQSVHGRAETWIKIFKLLAYLIPHDTMKSATQVNSMWLKSVMSRIRGKKTKRKMVEGNRCRVRGFRFLHCHQCAAGPWLRLWSPLPPGPTPALILCLLDGSSSCGLCLKYYQNQSWGREEEMLGGLGKRHWLGMLRFYLEAEGRQASLGVCTLFSIICEVMDVNPVKSHGRCLAIFILCSTRLNKCCSLDDDATGWVLRYGPFSSPFCSGGWLSLKKI